MSSSLRHGALAAAAIAFSIASLAACGAGNNAQTLQVRPDNAATAVGDIKIQNAIVVTQPDPESTGPAVISATVFNNGSTDQTLDSITVDEGGKTAELKPAKDQASKGAKIVVPAGGSVIIGGKDNASAVLTSVGDAVKDGNAQKITFSFSKTGDVGLAAFVVPAESYFEKWGPTDIPEVPAASAEPTDSASPSGSPTGTAEEEDQAAAGSEASPSNSASESSEAAGH
ncbi:hypothetical protein SGFS_056270 [Streptomyces graminofaciens]|uniref:Lipoprotein n=1 Tax=Streptomyces graminofaciens TaxID=68212 RepID=A0ABM7FDU5_9ACTN|nr:DUF461 domain-containing protein [Streptomyces graminofaciens]BBC34333.1 hypothetical protein SGFS_056270 [Streptomyces graminofaciens]